MRRWESGVDERGEVGGEERRGGEGRREREGRENETFVYLFLLFFPLQLRYVLHPNYDITTRNNVMIMGCINRGFIYANFETSSPNPKSRMTALLS